MIYFLYLLLGLLPSLIWLSFYLKKDNHPESKRMILIVFLLGVFISLPVIILEKGLSCFLTKLTLPLTLFTFILFVNAALVEELLKYSVVKIKVLKSSEFDEPVDSLIYMIVVALGFAAIENILILFKLNSIFSLSSILFITLLRFLGATFLHALTSGIIGYFLALSLYQARKRFLIQGIIIAITLHGFYNFFIMRIEQALSFFLLVILLISLAIFLNFAFKRLKKLKSTCKI